MSTPTPQLTIELGCRSVIEFSELAPLLGPRGLFTTSTLRQLERDTGRRYDVVVAPYPVEKAKWELEAEVLKHQDIMTRVPVLGDRMKALLEAGDATDDVYALAELIKQARSLGSTPFFGLAR